MGPGHLAPAGVVDAHEQHLRPLAHRPSSDRRGITTFMAAAAASGYRILIAPRASAAPTSWNAMNPGTEDGAMPANVSENIRANVTAGLAKLVDDVKKYA